MSMSIRSNVGSLNAQRNLTGTQNGLNSTLSKLSSGYRITKAGDDAAGLAISEKLRAQIGGLNQAIRNANDGISMIQTAEGATQEIHTMLQRMNQLAVQGANGTTSAANRASISQELKALREEVLAIADRTTFNGAKLIGDGATDVTFQIGNEAGNGHTLDVTFKDVTVGGDLETVLEAINDIDISDLTTDTTFDHGVMRGLITSVGVAIDEISSFRSELGAAQNRLDHTIANLGITAENLTASESRIRDVNVAEETANMAKSQVLMQAGISVLAQANQMPQMALKLLG